MWTLWQKLVFGTGAVLTIFAVYLLMGPDSRSTDLWKSLEREGVVAQGKVIEKHVEEHVNYEAGSRGGRRSVGIIIREHNRRAENATVSYLHFLDVEFKTAEGQTVRSKENIPGQHFGGIDVGAQVPILYHPKAPSEISRLRDHVEPYEDMSELHRIMAMFSLAVAAILLFWGRPRGRPESDSSGRDLRTAASDRTGSVRDGRHIPSRVPVPGSAAPRGFGQPRRSVRS